jgi:hypothetical protein
MRAVGVALALIGGFGVVVTMGAFALSSVCWEYCEDEPTVGDACSSLCRSGWSRSRPSPRPRIC